MAHEAVVSLNLIIESLLNIGYRYTHDPILRNAELIHEEVWSLKSILELDHFEESERLNAFKGEILEAVPKFRDLLQDLVNKTQLRFSESQSRRERSLKLSRELDHDKESEILNALNEDIMEAVPIFKDLLQDFMNQTQLLFSGSQSLDDESSDALIFSQDLENVKEEMISFLETMKKINKENDFLCGNDEENQQRVQRKIRSGNKQQGVTTC
ncbi:hypothetical protein ACJIZ3_009310 [Penstemon smallii]|uniref:Uncharacterized protein n=1 Tax=Penstemon smallii TaxID=265156 RepID=A0ABD3TC71_9LAMI